MRGYILVILLLLIIYLNNTTSTENYDINDELCHIAGDKNHKPLPDFDYKEIRFNTYQGKKLNQVVASLKDINVVANWEVIIVTA